MSDIPSLVPVGSIVPVLVFNNVDEALAISRVLTDAGLPLEVTLRTPAALDCIRAIAQEIPQAMVGAGTVMNAELAQQARSAGARFGVSPGLTDSLAVAVKEMNWPFLPGVATLSEVMSAVEAGFRYLKFFPAEISGGRPFLNAVGSVLPDIRFCPTGGLNSANVAEYLALANVHAVGGTWMIVRHADGSPDLASIRDAAASCASFRNQ